MAERSVALVLLAAGRGRRFGSDKLAAKLDGMSVIDHAIASANAASFSARFIVRRLEAVRVETGHRWSLVVNEQADEGMASSIRCGVRAASAHSHIVIALADMPYISAGHLNALAARDIPTFTQYPDSRAGCPAAFPREAYSALLSLRGDCGAASLQFSPSAKIVPPSGQALQDIDLPSDLRSE